MANEKELRIRLPVVPELDKRGTSNLMRDISRLEKDLGKVNLNYKELAKTSQLNVKEIKNIVAGAESLGNKLTDAAQKSFKALGQTAKKIDSARKKAEKLEQEAAKAGDKGDKGGQEKLQREYVKVTKSISDMNKQLDTQKKASQQHMGQLKRLGKEQDKHISKLKEFGDFKPKDALKGVFGGIGKAVSGDVKGGLMQALSSAGKGVAGKVARGAEEKAASTVATKGAAAGAGEAAAAGEALGVAAGAISAGVIAIAAFVKLILAASDHMAGLNKALLAGSGLANEWGASAGDYKKAIDNIRASAIKLHGPLLDIGVDSEEAMSAVGAFAKNATGSIVKTELMLKQMGKGDLDRGMVSFVKNAKIYGKALGMETTEVAGLMGDMISNIGLSGDNVEKTMGDIVKQASQAGMPVSKFMDIFHSAIPNLDLFTNRIEELTGVMKLLSKSMDPRAVKSFMQAMGKGFDQMDFKSRLKLQFVAGVGATKGAIDKDVSRGTESIADQLKNAGLADEFKKAMSSPDSQKAVALIAAKAQAAGVSGATIGQMNKLARMKDLNNGGVLDRTTAMRDMGLMGRLSMLEKASKFGTGKNTGLGEHVAAKMGIQGPEYQALLDLRASLDNMHASLKKAGRTSSKSINDNLKKQLKMERSQYKDGKQGDEEFEQAFEKKMKDLEKSSPDAVDDMIKQASTAQMDQQQADAEAQKKAEEGAATTEDFLKEQVNATQSIGDKLMNVIKVILEKIFFAINSVLELFSGLYDMLPGWISGSTKDEQKFVNQQSKDAASKLGKDNTVAIAYFQDEMKKLSENLGAGKSTREIMNDSSQLLLQQLGSSGKNMTPEQEASQRDILSSAMDKDDVDKFIKASKAGDLKTTDSMLDDLNKSELSKVLTAAATKQAQTMKGQTDVAKYKDGTSKTELQTKREIQKQIAAKTGDIDSRTAGLLGVPDPNAPAAAAIPTPDDTAKAVQKGVENAQPQTGPQAAVGAPGSTPTGGPAAAAAKDQQTNQEKLVKAAEDHKDTADEQLKKQEQDYQSTTDVLSLLKKGVKFETSWMNTKLKSMLDKVVLENMRTALMEQLLLQAKMAEEPDFRKGLADNAWNVMDSGLSPMELATLKDGGEIDAANRRKKQGFAAGGYTGDGPLTKEAGTVHGKEFVVPHGGALIKGGGGKTQHIGTVNVHIQTNDPHEVRRVVDDMFNKGH